VAAKGVAAPAGPLPPKQSFGRGSRSGHHRGFAARESGQLPGCAAQLPGASNQRVERTIELQLLAPATQLAQLAALH